MFFADRADSEASRDTLTVSSRPPRAERPGRANPRSVTRSGLAGRRSPPERPYRTQPPEASRDPRDAVGDHHRLRCLHRLAPLPDLLRLVRPRCHRSARRPITAARSSPRSDPHTSGISVSASTPNRSCTAHLPRSHRPFSPLASRDRWISPSMTTRRRCRSPATEHLARRPGPVITSKVSPRRRDQRTRTVWSTKIKSRRPCRRIQPNTTTTGRKRVTLTDNRPPPGGPAGG